jgi:hypothetical protein
MATTSFPARPEPGRSRKPRRRSWSESTRSTPPDVRGGKLSYSIVLAQVPMRNFARDLLDIVESAGKALDPSATLASWTKLTDVVLDGFDRLMRLAGVEPLMGVRRQHDADADGEFVPGHFAMIDADDPNPGAFWVQGDKLMQGVLIPE